MKVFNLMELSIYIATNKIWGNRFTRTHTLTDVHLDVYVFTERIHVSVPVPSKKQLYFSPQVVHLIPV